MVSNPTNNQGVQPKAASVEDDEFSHEQPEFAKQVECLDENALGDLLDFANRVQAWSWRGGRRTPRFGTFQQAATALGVSVEHIALAVEAHYWMFADDPSAPIGERQIEHEGE